MSDTKELRLGFILELSGPGLWGAGGESLEATIPTQKCWISGEVRRCVSPSYIKGLLRGSSVRVVPILLKSKAISGGEASKLIEEVFGEKGSLPAWIDVSPGVFLERQEDACRVFFEDSDVPGSPTALILHHVALSDSSNVRILGALYSEERVASRYLYSEVSVKPVSDLCRVGMLLLAAVANLKYSTVGRSTTVRDVKVLIKKDLASKLLERCPPSSHILNYLKGVEC